MEEARELLQSKLDLAQTSKRSAEEDLEFLRDQITTMEVSILFTALKKCFYYYYIFLTIFKNVLKP